MGSQCLSFFLWITGKVGYTHIKSTSFVSEYEVGNTFLKKKSTTRQKWQKFSKWCFWERCDTVRGGLDHMFAICMSGWVGPGVRCFNLWCVSLEEGPPTACEAGSVMYSSTCEDLDKVYNPRVPPKGEAGQPLLFWEYPGRLEGSQNQIDNT